MSSGCGVVVAIFGVVFYIAVQYGPCFLAVGGIDVLFSPQVSTYIVAEGGHFSLRAFK